MSIILLKSRYKSCKNVHLYLWISKGIACPSLICIFASTSFLFSGLWNRRYAMHQQDVHRLFLFIVLHLKNQLISNSNIGSSLFTSVA